MLDELRQIAIFTKTVDHGSFRGAAKALRLSPSVVSHHVGQLEQSLGTALLYRSTRKLSLTADGERLLEAGHAMIKAAETGLQGIGNQMITPSGRLRLTAPAILAQSNLTRQFGEFALAYPEVSLSIDLSDSRRDIIADGFDMAISIGELKDSSMKARKLFEIDRALVAAPMYLEKHPTPKTPDDIENWDWLELAPVWHKKPVFRKGRKRKTIQKRRTRVSVNNAQALVQLARSGSGLGMVPGFLASKDIDAGNLKNVIKDWTVEPLGVFAVWPSNAPNNGLIRHFLDFIEHSESSADLD